MNLELTDREARLLRAQLVRHIVELEDEVSRTNVTMLERALAVEIRSLREVYARLTAMLDPESPASSLLIKAARVAAEATAPERIP